MTANYENHYSPRLNKCLYLEISTSYERDVADTVELIRRTGRVEEQAIQLLERLRIDNHKSFYFELFGKPYG
jgi:hypothetical protein